MAELFKIGANYDLTTHIKAPTYKVNNLPVTEEWTDANYTKHREIVRMKAQGSFTVLFSTIDEYEEFLRVVEENTVTDGSTLVTLYIHNQRHDQNDIVKTTYVFLDYDPQDTLPMLMGEEDDGFEISVEER